MVRMTLAAAALAGLIAFAFLVQGCGDDGGTGPTNKAPVITSLTAEPSTVDPTGTSTIICTATDPDADSLSFAWTAQAGNLTGSGDQVEWRAPFSAGEYPIAVTVTDEKNRSTSDTAYVTVTGGTLLADNDGELLAIDLSGDYFTLYDSYSSNVQVEVLGERIFTGRGTMYEISHAGEATLLFSSPEGVPWATATVVLPDAGFAFINNETDSIYFVDATGVFDRMIEVPHPSPSGLQSTAGTVVGNNLVMVDTRSNSIWQIDLATDQISSIVEITDAGNDLSDVDYSGGAYYAVKSFTVYKYVPGGEPELLATIPDANFASICVVGKYAYVGSNGRSEIYRFDTATGQYEVFVDGLISVEDIEFLPVTLTQ